MRIATQMADTDYRLLLQKYIIHVGENEGVDYISFTATPPPYFTDEEWQALQQASADSNVLEEAIFRAKE